MVAGVNLLIRPNLVLLAGAPVVTWIFGDGRQRPQWRTVAHSATAYSAGILGALIALVMVNVSLYGSPFESGYGSFSDLYGLAVLPQNVRNYALWMWQTQSLTVLAGLIPFVVQGTIRRRTVGVCLVALFVLTLVSYVFYNPFENWTYLRFLLPAFPALFVFVAAGVWTLCRRVPLPARVAVALILGVAVVSPGVRFARDQYILNWHTHEQRYARAGLRVRELAPSDAVLFSSQHSGSLRYYTDRLTLRYDLLGDRRLDSAIRELNDKGRPSYLVIDEWEHADFRKRFAPRNRAGTLDWAPLARIPGPPDVLIYDLTSTTK
jgi:hypothetical protein